MGTVVVTGSSSSEGSDDPWSVFDRAARARDVPSSVAQRERCVLSGRRRCRGARRRSRDGGRADGAPSRQHGGAAYPDGRNCCAAGSHTAARAVDAGRRDQDRRARDERAPADGTYSYETRSNGGCPRDQRVASRARRQPRGTGCAAPGAAVRHEDHVASCRARDERSAARTPRGDQHRHTRRHTRHQRAPTRTPRRDQHRHTPRRTRHQRAPTPTPHRDQHRHTGGRAHGRRCSQHAAAGCSSPRRPAAADRRGTARLCIGTGIRHAFDRRTGGRSAPCACAADTYRGRATGRHQSVRRSL